MLSVTRKKTGRLPTLSAQTAASASARPRQSDPDSNSNEIALLDAEALAWTLRREEMVRVGRSNPAVRLASLLIVLAHRNREHGIDMMLISDVANCAYVAGLLKISIDEIAELLLCLHAAGMIKPLQDGQLQITNVEALERLSDAPGLSLLRAHEGAPGDRSTVSFGRTARHAPLCYVRSASAEETSAQSDAYPVLGIAAVALGVCLSAALAVTLGLVSL
jgi:hypothetical protein